MQDWASGFGDPVDATPYGMPIEFESHVVRRNVEWLTESPVSSINFTPIHALEGTITPQGCAFERHHSGAIELAKPDYRLMVNGLVDRPLVFTFEDLRRLEGRAVQALLKEIATEQLTLALKTASPELREKIFANVSSRAAANLREELELMGPVRVSDVEEAQRAIVDTALRLERDGVITIAREGSGELV